MEEILILMEKHGVKFDDREEFKLMLKYSIEKGWFKTFKKDNNFIGFMSYIVEEHEDGKFVFISNITIFKGYEKEINFYEVRKQMMKDLGKVKKCQWRSIKRQREFIHNFN